MTLPILVTGDLAVFPAAWPTLLLDAELPVALRGSGRTRCSGKEMVVERDLKAVILTPCPYKTPSHTLPGVGTLTIQSILPVQASRSVQTAKTPALVQQARFIAKFEVLTPATLPGPTPVPDPMPIHVGTGEFRSSNKRVSTRR